MPKWLKVVLIVLAVVFTPPVLLQVSHVIGTAPMIAISDRMHPDPAWKMDGQNITGGLFCISYDVDCDSMWRSYRTSQEVTPADLQRIIDETAGGAKVQSQGDCVTSPLPANSNGMFVSCSASAVVDGYDVEVRALNLSKESPDKIIQFRISSVKNRQ